MRDLGCTVRNDAGSAVNFEHADKGKIVFHGPHLEAKVDPILLRAIGKRLTKCFDQELRSFGLEAAS